MTPPKSQLLLMLSILLGEDGGGSLATVLAVGHNSPSSPMTPHLGDLFFEAWEDPPKKFFLGDIKTTNPVVAKSYKKPYLSSSFFYLCHPSIVGFWVTCGV